MKRALFLSLVANIVLATGAQDTRIWSTYYGNSGPDGGFACATDSSGNVYLAGITGSTTGIAAGGFQSTFGGGNRDAYLVKFNSAGVREWATFYGGTGDEMAFFGGKIGLTTDPSGNVYLAGLSNSTSGIASGGFQNSINGTMNAYLVKFDPSGGRLWATYYGGGTVEKGYGVACDVSGNVYLAGVCGSTSGIASGGFQNSIGGSSDAFLVKFDELGNRLWATYYGGTNADEAFSLATDLQGNVYMAGYTNSLTAIASGGFQNNYGGGAYDAFLVKFDASGARLWGTYYGGSGDELALFAGDISVATDPLGNVYLTGLTTSTTGIASGGFQNTYGGGSNDAFLVKFSDAGARLWATYYGGTASDRGYDVAADAQQHAYLVGRTSSANAIGSGGFQNNLAGDDDAFLAKFDANGDRLCATYYGGVGVDDCNSVAVDPSGAVYLAGGSENTSGIAVGGFQTFFGGGSFDAMLVKFTSNCISTSVADPSSAGNAFTVFPDPSHGIFTVALGDLSDRAELEVIDLLGAIILRQQHIAPRSMIQLDLSGVAEGIYFLAVRDGTDRSVHRIIVER